MSVVHSNLQRGAAPVKAWYLKSSDGKIYGPVQISVLAEWAAQGRIVPGNQVSEDRQGWVPAESLPELKMDWVAELADGSVYGPFHLLATPYLHQSGAIPLQARIINRTTGKSLSVRELLKSSPVQPDTRVGKSGPPVVEHGQTSAAASAAADESGKWQERYQEEHRTRLLQEARMQEMVDRLTSEARQSSAMLAAAEEKAQKLSLIHI